MELTIGRKTFSGYTYDISQGGLSFIADDTIGLGLATLRVPNSSLVFQGKILGSQGAGKPGLCRFHFQFTKSFELAILAEILES